MDIRPQLDRGFREELRAQRRGDRVEARNERREDRVARRESRRGNRNDTPTQTPIVVDPSAPVVSIQPVPPQSGSGSITPPASNSSPSDSSVRSLAEKYVDVYSKQTGRTLSSATRDALVNDVASFYGESGGRTERLKTLVGVF